MDGKRIALVLGATGGVGGEVARALRGRGWMVRALARRPPPAATDGLAWTAGDALRARDVARAAEGAALIVHAVNPPGYRDWDKVVLPMLDNTVAAARAAGARIALPGTVYNYGPDAFPGVTEAAPQHPVTRKGAIRVRMERTLREAADAGTPSLVVRAGDFFGPRPGNGWLSQGMIKPGAPLRSVTALGRPGTGHQWAYLPDVAEVFARLLDRADRLAPFDTFHMDGHWDPDGTAMVEAIRRAAGPPPPPVKRFPWWALPLASPFVPTLREMREMRYLWREPVRLGNQKLVAFLGEEPRTPLDEAVRATLRGLGCLPPDA